MPSKRCCAPCQRALQAVSNESIFVLHECADIVTDAEEVARADRLRHLQILLHDGDRSIAQICQVKLTILIEMLEIIGVDQDTIDKVWLQHSRITITRNADDCFYLSGFLAVTDVCVLVSFIIKIKLTPVI